MAQSQNLDVILESQSKLQALFVERMETMENELKKTNSPGSSVTVSSLSAEYFKFKDFVLTAFRAIQAQIALLSDKIDKCEMHKRRKILLLHGVGDSENEDITALVTDTFVNRLKINDFSATDITRCHRMGRPSGQNHPRPILVKIRAMDIRNRIWYAKTKLRGSGITLSEFLTKTQHDIFVSARQKLGINKCWTREGYVFALGPDGARRRLDCMEDINLIAASASGQRKQPTAPKESAAPSIKSRRGAISSKK